MTKLPLDHFIPYRINIIAKRISTSLSSIYLDEYGLSIAQWRVLVWVNYHESLFAKEISQYTRMDKTQVSRAVEQLVKVNLLSRQRTEKDHRSVALKLTKDGQVMLDKLIPKALAWEEQLTSALTSEEYKQLLASLQKIEQQLNALDRDDE